MEPPMRRRGWTSQRQRAAAVRTQLRESREGGGPCEAVLQVAYADTILLNKVRVRE